MPVLVWHCLSGLGRRSSRTLRAHWNHRLRHDGGLDFDRQRADMNSGAGRGRSYPRLWVGLMTSRILPLHRHLGRKAQVLVAVTQLHHPLVHVLGSNCQM